MSDTEENKQESSKEKQDDISSEDEENTRKTPETSPPKAKNSKKSQEVEDSEEEESDEEQKLGLLEQPVIIESGKRQKKKVERLDMSSSTPKDKVKVEIAEGSGTKLGDCPRVELQLQKNKADDLKPLHRLLFSRVGAATVVKKNIRQFSGFTFDKSDKEYEKKTTMLNKCTLPMLKFMCEVLDLERKGTKEEIVDKILTFCMQPKSSGKALPKSKRKSSSSDKKRKRKEKKNKQNSSQKKKSKPDEKGDIVEDSESSEDDEEDEKSDKSDVSSESEEEVPPKKKSKKETTATPKTEKSPKKTPQKEKSSSEGSDSDSDEEPLVKKKKPEPPSNAEIKKVIKSILDKADLEELTMKSVLKEVYGKYPDFDLSDKKEFIKKTVKQLIT